MTAISYPDACCDPNLFGPWFTGPSWANWRVVDKALFGLPLTADELSIFHQLTGREQAPTERAGEAWIIAGRRAGKDVKAASLITYLATIGAEAYGWRKYLTRGERGVVQLLAVDRDQARVCFDYTCAFFEQPLLASLVTRITADEIQLSNGFSIEITTNDKRRVRGRTVVAAVFDEVAHWRSEQSISPDHEVYRAVRPSMLTIPNSLLIGISSPHIRKGLLFEKHREHWGRAGKVLVVQAPTWALNLTQSANEGEIAEAYAADPAWAAAEYGAEWRSDLEAYISAEAVAAVTSQARERPPQQYVSYTAFVDVSSGVNDSAALAIGHMQGKMSIVDCVREVKPPHSPGAAVEDFCELLRKYQCWTVRGDRYSIGFVREAFAQRNVTFEPCEQNKSELYASFAAMVNTGAVDLLRNERATAQFLSLERRPHMGARDAIDHPRSPNCHDDLANSIAGVAVLAMERGDVMPPHRLQTHAIGASYDLLATAAENAAAMHREEQRAGFFTEPDVGADLGC